MKWLTQQLCEHLWPQLLTKLRGGAFCRRGPRRSEPVREEAPDA